LVLGYAFSRLAFAAARTLSRRWRMMMREMPALAKDSLMA
jgi:hypothetical protein